jgi:hypothetical protein
MRRIMRSDFAGGEAIAIPFERSSPTDKIRRASEGTALDACFNAKCPASPAAGGWALITRGSVAFVEGETPLGTKLLFQHSHRRDSASHGRASP